MTAHSVPSSQLSINWEVKEKKKENWRFSEQRPPWSCHLQACFFREKVDLEEKDAFA